MDRGELPLSDNELKQTILKAYRIEVESLQFIDSGSFYGFICTTAEQQRYFLKVYEESLSSVKQLNQQGNMLARFREQYGLHSISDAIPNYQGQYCYATPLWLYMVYAHIDGIHPSYDPNTLEHNQLAQLFAGLHSVPVEEFPECERESYDLSYALGIVRWLDSVMPAEPGIHPEGQQMLQILHQNRESIEACIADLLKKQVHYTYLKKPGVLTHGDPHHYNVLQTPIDVWLVDWDGIKIAPPERDLWHYLDTSLYAIYESLPNALELDKTLCEFYRKQRFIEDLRFYLDNVMLAKNLTLVQNEKDFQDFSNHWGWKFCRNY